MGLKRFYEYCCCASPAGTFLALGLLVVAGCPAPAARDVITRDLEPAQQATQESDTVSENQAEAPEAVHTNRLVNETSPYLLQHAHNPVDWYPWGEEALARAREEDRPIFLSIGYSSCHWCHVMERESFENEAIAAVMNEHFVNIKVDREERPDLDEIYMAAVQAMTGSGGWPMSVFLTPNLEPFYGGTYFPAESKYGRPGFKTVLEQIASTWDQRREEVMQTGQRLAKYMKEALSGNGGTSSPLTPDLITAATDQLRAVFDEKEGGFGGAPKFPSSPSIALLLREYQRSGDAQLLHMATLTLDKMAYGGMYDHLGGGFARYSTDDRWLVPHFEKMLYDNAQLTQVYLEAYQVTGNDLYRRVAEEIFSYVLRDMRDEKGGFYSAEDADSEGEEGKFYLWTYDEIIDRLGAGEGKLFCEYYGFKRRGNFDSHETYHRGLNIMYMPLTHDAAAKKAGISEEALQARLGASRKKLFEIRDKRVRPGLDDKVLTSWNALMISSFAQGYQVLRNEEYRRAAEEAASFILSDMMPEGELLRTYRKGSSRLPAYLDDYAFMALALLDLYEATFDLRWIENADALVQTMIAKFWEEDQKGFYFTSKDHKHLLVRTRPTYDGAVPSGNSMAALALLRLSKFLDSDEYFRKAKVLLESHQSDLSSSPRGYLKMLCAADLLLYPPKEIAIAGPANSDEVAALLSAVHGSFVPNKVLAFVDPSHPGAESLGKRVPLLAGKALVNGQAAAYVCKNFACRLPVTTPDALRKELGVPERNS